MRERRDAGAAVDALFADLLEAGESVPGIRDALARHAPDDPTLVALLRRAVPARLLEHLGTVPPWSDRRRVLGAIALNPKTPRTLALRLVPALFWRDLAEVALSPRVANAVRVRAEGLLKEMLTEMRLGDRIALARMATPTVLAELVPDAEPLVVRAALQNPRLREEDLLLALGRDTARRGLIEETASSSRWRASYSVRRALVLQPRTPLPVALAQISSLLERDLWRVAETPGLAPLVRAAAQRVAGAGEGKPSGREPGI